MRPAVSPKESSPLTLFVRPRDKALAPTKTGKDAALLLAVVEASMDWPTILGLTQVVVLAVTAVSVFWYTWETQRLRKAAEQQIEVQQRPFIILTPEEREGVLEKLKIHNIGNSAAINIHLTIDGKSITLPVLRRGQGMSGPVIPAESDSITQALRTNRRYYGEANPYHLGFRLSNASITDGFQFTVKYRNVAMECYETVEKLWPRGFEIIHSGKREPSA